MITSPSRSSTRTTSTNAAPMSSAAATTAAATTVATTSSGSTDAAGRVGAAEVLFLSDKLGKRDLRFIEIISVFIITQDRVTMYGECRVGDTVNEVYHLVMF